MNNLDLLQTIAIVVSILMGAWQVRSHTKQLRYDQLTKRMEDFNEMNMIGFTNPDFYPELSEPYDGNTAKSKRAFWMIGYIHNKFWQAYRHHRLFKAQTAEEWNGNAQALVFWFRTPFGRGWWEAHTANPPEPGLYADFEADINSRLD